MERIGGRAQGQMSQGGCEKVGGRNIESLDFRCLFAYDIRQRGRRKEACAVDCGEYLAARN